MTTLGANACNCLSGFKIVKIKFRLFYFIQMSHAAVKRSAVILKSLHFLGMDCGEKENKTRSESGFGFNKKNALVFFHNPEFIVSQ